MTSAYAEGDSIKLTLSRSEALVLFEWLSRNWESTQWDIENFFSDPAEKQILIWIENDLSKILDEPLKENYKDIIQKLYRDII